MGLVKVADGLFGDANAVIHIAVKKEALSADGENVRLLLYLLKRASPTLVASSKIKRVHSGNIALFAVENRGFRANDSCVCKLLLECFYVLQEIVFRTPLSLWNFNAQDVFVGGF